MRRGKAMKTRSVMLSVICATAAVGVMIWLAVEHQAGLRLRQENTALRQQLDLLAGVLAENERLSNLVAQAGSSQSLPDERLTELLRLRGEVGVLRQQSKELETLRNGNREAHTALTSSITPQSAGQAAAVATADYWPRDSWSFAGYASPDASLQSFLWAASKGDVKTLQGGITGEIEKMVAKDLEGKSDSEASAKAMAELAPLKSVLVLNREVQADDRVVLTTVFEDANRTETNKTLMKKIGNDWKFSGSP